MKKLLHRCPAPGCLARIPSHLAFCTSHWIVLPSQIKRDILTSWGKGAPGSEHHKAAIASALRALMPREEQTA